MRKIISVLSVAMTMFIATSCGAFANMSYEDAYNVGYGIGTAARYLLDN